MDRKRKVELRELNTRAWAGDADVFPTNSSLDSSLKKNTAFIKRLRTSINGASLPTFLQEIRTLSLHKYLSEVISACYEGLCKLKTPVEVNAGIEVVSALHQRFGAEEFTGNLGWLVGRGLSTPEKAQLKGLTADAREKEEKERLARQRILLRVVTELWLVTVLRSLDDVNRPDEVTRGKENNSGSGKSHDGSHRTKHNASADRSASSDTEPFPLEVLKDLLRHDRSHTNLSLVVQFVKIFNTDVLGFQNKSTEKAEKLDSADEASNGVKENEAYNSSGTEDETPAEPRKELDPMISDALQERFRNVVKIYFNDVKNHIIRDQKVIAQQAHRNTEAYVRSGEVFEDRQGNYEKQVKTQEKLISNAQILSEVLGEEMPDLKETNDTAAATDGSIGLVNTGEYLRGQGDGPGIWEDEEERRFYENLINLKDRVPAVLLEDHKKKKGDGEEKADQKASDAKETEDEKAADLDDQSTIIVNKSVGAQVDILLARLPDLATKEMIDEFAIDFCFVNSKASRNRLLKAISEIPKGRSDLLPRYARLIATLGRHLLDIPQGLVAHLDTEFRSLQRRKDKDFLGQVRLSNIRYLAELTKFGVVAEHVIFHCFKVSLDDFSRMNIEILCNLLENCGRYLLRNPETSPRMTSFLETLQRKKGAQHLGQQERMLIDNAIYYVNPPPRPAIQQKDYSPIEQFIRKLIYQDMNKRNTLKIIKQVRKMHWEDEEVCEVLEKVFSKPKNVKYSNIHLLAEVVSSLFKYHQEWVIMVIDNILELVIVGLEVNDFRYNQRRVAEVKYLAELYTYRMVDSPVIFDTLYRIVLFGHEGGTPRPGQVCSLDLADDFIRLRLVCTILDTCGVCFERGNARKKLDFFLAFFQARLPYYTFTKDTLPFDVEFMVHDTFALVRPEWKLATNLEEAGNIFNEAVSKNYRSTDEKEEKIPEQDTPEDSLSENEAEDQEPQKGDDAFTSDDGEAEPDVDGEHSRAESEDEQIVVTRKEDEEDPEFEGDFDRDFAKMMTDGTDSRKFERKQAFDAPIPIKKHTRDTSAPIEEVTKKPQPQQLNTMSFALLSKKGNKQHSRNVDLPSSSHFAVSMRSQQEAGRAEQQRIKNLVLNYDLREEEHDGTDRTLATLIPNSNTKYAQGHERQSGSQNRSDKGNQARRGPPARKLQLSDVDWYSSKKSHSARTGRFDLSPLSSSRPTR
ncbi:MAG: hypothetical protein M1814_004821 [Vezdaea aestivalis]|nr:MAG: hypothetical protein M1814_004821 [Vezdaea aestivalis]